MVNDRPQWAEKLRFWLSDGQFDALDTTFGKVNDALMGMAHVIESRIENGADHLDTVGQKALCLWFGHKPVPDQCNKPEHDFCVYCHRSMPNSAHGPQY